MKLLSICIVMILSIAALAMGQHQHEAEQKSASGILLSGFGSYHHPVSTKNPEAQKYFDQGLTLIYAFNHEEAIRSFRKALELDPGLVMAYWGIAYALGPNINLDVDPDREKQAYDAVQKALSLASSAPANERAYIEALSKRYSNDPAADLKKLAIEYKDAMKALVTRYPDDLDLAVLYADSLMNLRPWKLWKPDGTPEEGTAEMVTVLESVLKRFPMHPGANHLYIHAVEASPRPESALPSAERLKTLVPAAGHLVHMPAHIYVRTGNYEEAAIQNENAIQADEGYFKESGIKEGVYPSMYYNHNIHFLAYARSMQGRYADAKKAADQVVSNALPYVKEMPMLDAFIPTSMQVLLRFRKWDDILNLPKPEAGLPITQAFWYYSRGIAYARKDRILNAEKTKLAFDEAAQHIPADAMFGLNPAAAVIKVAELHLHAEIAYAKKNPDSAKLFEKAIEAEAAITYNEPPDWYYPIRETYGAVLLKSGRAPEAETVFREDLSVNPGNGRSLFGLMESLKAQNKTAAVTWVKQQFDQAWKKADTVLRVGDL
jgi:tetratricopeptide (TPR) repeat protein